MATACLQVSCNTRIDCHFDFNFPGLVHQLSLAGGVSSVSELRQQTAAELRTNSGQYLPFLSLSPEQFEVSRPLIGQC